MKHGQMRWSGQLVAAALLTTGCQAKFGVAKPVAKPSLERFQSEVEAFRNADAVRRPATCQTLLVGSSSIRMWDDADRRFSFPIVRRGVGGSTIAEINHYFTDIVAPYSPSRIVLYAGENDLNEGKSPHTVMADLRQFMALKRRALGSTPVYFISTKPSPSRIADLPNQSKFNAMASALAAREPDLAFIDVASAMGGRVPVRPELFREDRLHMLPIGYDIWTRVITEALAKPAESRAPGC